MFGVTLTDDFSRPADANVMSTSHNGVHYIRHAGTLVAEVVNLPMTKTKSYIESTL